MPICEFQLPPQPMERASFTRFEYVKRNNRETGAALVGIELGAAEDLSALLNRMDASPIDAQRLEPGSPAYRYLT